MQKKTYHIPDMQCPNCAMILEGIEDHLAGVKQVSASYHKLQMVVEYDETIVNEEQIIAAVKKKGYQIVSV